MSFEVISLYLASVVVLLLGAIVLARSYQKTYGWFFIAAVLGVVFWAVGDALILTLKSQQYMPSAALIFYIGPMAIPVFMWFFALVFPERRANKIAVSLGGAVFALAGVAIAIWPRGLLRHVQITQSGLNIVHINTSGFVVYAAYFSLMFTISYITLIRLYRTQRTAILRTQVLYVLVGLLLASVPALFTNLTLPLLGDTRVIWLGPIFSVIFVAAVTISIIRHRLFDIQLIIARSLGYVLSIGVMAAVFSLLVALVINRTILTSNHMTIGQQLVYGVAAIVVGVLYPFLKRFFDKVTNRIFYRDSYDAQAFIERLNRVLIASSNLDVLLHDASSVIDSNLKSSFVNILVRETNYAPQRSKGTRALTLNEEDDKIVRAAFAKQHRPVIVTDDVIESDHKLYEVLSRYNIAMVTPLVSDLRRDKVGIGYVFVGVKKSGNAYSKKDVKIIHIIANELIIAIQNALHFEEIQNFNATLQQKVVEATNKLRRTNEKLKELDETKDDFISMASHQLRTPLTSVKGYLSMVLEGDAGNVNKMQREMLGQAFFSSQRMVYLIADLLNVSRLKTGKFVMEFTRVNLADMVEQEMSQLIETAAAKNIKLKYDKPAGFPDAMLDETKTRQVIMNFMDNAIYYTPKDGHIEIRLADTGSAIELRVVDDGIGVPKTEQHHLFTKFYRAANARKTRPDGTGLGLFMAKKVIVGQNGAVIFESQEGQGSTFGFSFSKKKLPTLVDGTAKPAES